MNPNTLPRISNDLNAPHNPRTFIVTWAETMALIEAAFASAGSGGGGNITPFLQNGWLKTSVDSEPAILPPGSPNLSVTLRDGAQLFLEGDWLTVDGDVLLGDMPIDAVSWLTLVYYVGEGNSQAWEPTWHEERPELGAGVVAQVTTDGEAVIDVVTSASQTDIIPSLPYLMQLLSPPDEGGEVGGPTQAQINALQLQINVLISEIAKLKEESGTDAEFFPQPFDVLSDNMALVAASSFELNPPGVERPQMAIVGENFGHGQNDTPDFTPDTGDVRELPFDAPTGLFGT